MVRVDARIEFVDTQDVGVERPYTITVDGLEVDSGTVIFDAPYSMAVVLDELERGPHTLSFTIDSSLPWTVKIWAWRQTEQLPPFKRLKERAGGETLIGEGDISSGTPLAAPLEAIPGPPMWAPGVYYREATTRGLITLLREILGIEELQPQSASRGNISVALVEGPCRF